MGRTRHGTVTTDLPFLGTTISVEIDYTVTDDEVEIEQLWNADTFQQLDYSESTERQAQQIMSAVLAHEAANRVAA
jgi:hypothetical protein